MQSIPKYIVYMPFMSKTAGLIKPWKSVELGARDQLAPVLGTVLYTYTYLVRALIAADETARQIVFVYNAYVFFFFISLDLRVAFSPKRMVRENNVFREQFNSIVLRLLGNILSASSQFKINLM